MKILSIIDKKQSGRKTSNEKKIHKFSSFFFLNGVRRRKIVRFQLDIIPTFSY